MSLLFLKLKGASGSDIAFLALILAGIRCSSGTNATGKTHLMIG